MGLFKAAAPAPSPPASTVGKAEASEKISKFVAKKKATSSSSSSGTGPLLDLHGSFSRAALLTPLRLAFRSDTLTLDDLKRLLCGTGLGLSEEAGAAISDQVTAAYGSSFTIEQLVSLLVPLKRVQSAQELSESELALMRRKFEGISDKEGTIEPSQLSRVAAEVPGLHDGPLSSADCEEIAARMRHECGGRADLETLFDMFREQQSASRAMPTQQQLSKAFGAFDKAVAGGKGVRGAEKGRVLPLERVRSVVKLHDGPTLKPEVIKLSKALLEGGAGDVSAKELAKQSKASHDIDVTRLIALYDEQLQKALAKEKEAEEKAAAKAQKVSAKEEKDAHGRGLMGGLFGLGHKSKSSEQADAAEAAKLVAEINAKVDAANEEQGKGGWLGGLFGGDKDSSTPQKKTTEPIATTGAPDEPTGKAEAAKPESVQML